MYFSLINFDTFYLLKPNCFIGLIFYIVPNLNKLKDAELWAEAAIQVIYSFGLAGGSTLNYASHNKFYNPVVSFRLPLRRFNTLWTRKLLIFLLTHQQVNYASLVWSINILTSFFVCFILFSTLGFYSSILSRPVGSVLSSGIGMYRNLVLSKPKIDEQLSFSISLIYLFELGLLFIVIPDRLANSMSWPILWSSFYFLILFIIGLNSQLSSLEVIYTFIDRFMVCSRLTIESVKLIKIQKIRSSLQRNKKRSKKVLNHFALCLIFFSLSFPFIKKSGANLLELTDSYFNGLSE